MANPLLVENFVRVSTIERVEDRVYEVTHQGETLRKIADKLFQKPHLWEALRNANHETLGEKKADDTLSVQTKIFYRVRKAGSRRLEAPTAPVPVTLLLDSSRSLAESAAPNSSDANDLGLLLAFLLILSGWTLAGRLRNFF